MLNGAGARTHYNVKPALTRVVEVPIVFYKVVTTVGRQQYFAGEIDKMAVLTLTGLQYSVPFVITTRLFHYCARHVSVSKC